MLCFGQTTCLKCLAVQAVRVVQIMFVWHVKNPLAINPKTALSLLMKRLLAGKQAFLWPIVYPVSRRKPRRARNPRKKQNLWKKIRSKPTANPKMSKSMRKSRSDTCVQRTSAKCETVGKEIWMRKDPNSTDSCEKRHHSQGMDFKWYRKSQEEQQWKVWED